MDFNTKLDIAIQNINVEREKLQEELDGMEKDFANVKLNPYGITNIDFSKRQELMSDILKMEGAVMGLNLAKENYAGVDAQ